MQVKLDNIDDILNINDENNFVNEVCNDFLLNNYNVINEKTLENDTMFNIFLEAEGIDFDSYENELLIKHHANVFNVQDTSEYLNNPYYLMVKPTSIKDKDICLTYNYYNPYELFVYDDVSIDNNYLETMKIGYFKNKFPYLVLLQNNKVWMSITPHEMNTMQEAIDNAYGKVLVYGLGLGYFPYMCSLKDNVKEITIIENDKRIIDVFNKNIFPLFKNKDKIQIICMDAISYAAKKIKYDYVFIDLWHEALDGIKLYTKLLSLEVSDSQYFYWIENSILSLARRCLITLIEETFYDNYQDTINNDVDLIISAMNTYLKDTIISNDVALHNLLSNTSIKNILKNLKI